ncbi:MAG: DUF411 domain-containing protein [Gemmatimonadaceae bacterium]
MRKLHFAIIPAFAVSVPLGAVALSEGTHDPAPVTITVYKTAQCGCCRSWVDHLRKHGFEVTAHDVEDVAAIKTKLGVPAELNSCHTAVTGAYVVEGHVPAADIQRLLAQKPKVAGLAVPGMPMGSPGMEMPGMKADKYDVIAFSKDGKRSVFASH